MGLCPYGLEYSLKILHTWLWTVLKRKGPRALSSDLTRGQWLPERLVRIIRAGLGRLRPRGARLRGPYPLLNELWTSLGLL